MMRLIRRRERINYMSINTGESAFSNVRRLINSVCDKINIAETHRLRLSECERESTGDISRVG